MKKKIFSAMLLFAFTLGTTSTFVSCKDYDDDINGLQEQIDALTTKIDDLNSQISAGSVITSVDQIANGWRITLSNNKTYDLQNGADGNNGKNGSICEIGEDGYWYIDKVKTEYKATGEKGADGKTGNYYVPNAETGCFDLYASDGTLIEATNISWKGENAKIYAVKNGSDLILYGIPNENGVIDANGITISLSNALRALVFSGDAVDSYGDPVQVGFKDAPYPAIRIKQLGYTSLKVTYKNNINGTEKWEVIQNNQSRNIWYEKNAATYAYYHVNPTTVNVEDLKEKMAFVCKDAEIITRGGSSWDYSATPEFVSYDSESGILKVKVNTTGEAADKNVWYDGDADKVAIVALQVTKDNEETVTSDYAGLQQTFYDDILLANADQDKKGVDTCHYRRGVIGINAKEATSGDKKAEYKDFSVWAHDKGGDADLLLPYESSINLYDKVVAHLALSNNISGKFSGKKLGDAVHDLSTDYSCASVDYKDLGFTLKFEVVTNMQYGKDQKTTMDQFVTLSDDGTLKSKTYNTEGVSAVGRTPVIRAILSDASGNIVNVSYIKVRIVKDDLTKNLTVDLGEINYKCGGLLKSSDEKTFNLQVYNAAGLESEAFHSTYSSIDLCNTSGLYTSYGWEKADGSVDNTITHPLATGAKEAAGFQTTTGAKIYEASNTPTWQEVQAAYYNNQKANANNVGTVRVVEESNSTDGTKTYKIYWLISEGEMWFWAGQEVSHTIKFYKPGRAEQVCTVTLKKTVVGGIKKQYDLTTASDYRQANWNNDIAQFNSSVNYNTANGSVIKTGLNELFVTKSNLMKLSDAIEEVNYFFDKDMCEGITEIGGYKVTFEVRNNTQLWLTSIKNASGKHVDKHGDAKNSSQLTTGGELIAEIYNTFSYIKDTPGLTIVGNDTKYRSLVKLNNNDFAKLLLNTNDLKAYFTVQALACGDENKEVAVTFNGKSYFQGEWIRPINLANTAAEGFVDKSGEYYKGSFITVEDLLQPTNWNGDKFTSYPALWSFYDVTDVEYLEGKSKTDINNPNGEESTWTTMNEAGLLIKIVEIRQYAPYGTTSLTNGDNNLYYYNIEGKITDDATEAVGVAMVDPSAQKVTKLAAGTKLSDCTAYKTSDWGYVVYQNNGTSVQKDFNLQLKVRISYKWGEVYSDYVKVPIAAMASGTAQ